MKGGEGTQAARQSERPAAHEGWDVSGTGPRSGPAGATAPARRKARKRRADTRAGARDASGASARRLREDNKERSERPAPEGYEGSWRGPG